MTSKPILVAVDFSPASLAAVRHACALAEEGAVVRLLHVVDTELLPHRAFLGQDLVERYYVALRSDAQRSLEQLARELENEGTRIETAIEEGRPADHLVAAAAGASLVVVGAHARSTIAGIALGSVAEAVARRSPVPTLIVREGAEERSAIRRVLLAVDLEAPSPIAIEEASRLATLLGATLEAVHVIPKPRRFPRAFGDRRALLARLKEEAPREVRKLLSRTIGRTTKITIRSGSAADEIVRMARKGDLVVCGTHGRGALGQLAFGSVALKLSRSAPCPVLVVPLEKRAASRASGRGAKARA